MNIEHDFENPIGRIVLNHPDKLNALSKELLVRLTELLQTVHNFKHLRVLILTGAGDKAFCAGTDIGELADLNEDEAKQASERGQRVYDLIENSPVPVIAAINGITAGGGFELALACHLRAASDTADFSLPETNSDLIPAYGSTQRLARIIGEGRVNELMIANKKIRAEEALKIGLINRVVPSSQLLNKTESMANEIAKLAPLAVRALLTAVIRGADLPIEDGLKLEAKLFSELFSTEDMREGTRAFLEKRQPNFQGE